MRNDILLCSPRPWTEWEDLPAGLWAERELCPSRVDQSMRLLSAPHMFEQAARVMINTWPISACAHLSDRRRGRRAWIGQATCCFSHGANRWETIEAWNSMGRTVREAANMTALQVILLWERTAERGCQLALFS